MKTNLTLLLTLLFFSVQAQVPFSEYFFTAGSLENTGSISNHLTQTGSALTGANDRDGYSANALSLNGDMLKEQTGGNKTNFSVSFWINTSTNDADNRYILDQYGGNPGGKGPIGYRVYLHNGDLKASARFWVYNGHSHYVSATTILTKTGIADGQWHHVVLTFTPGQRITTNGNIPRVTYKLYVDNVLEQTVTREITVIGGSPRTVDSMPLAVGNVQNGSAQHYQDKIDDIQLYNSVLSDVQVGELYSARTSPVTLYVKSDATGNNDGTSWADAYTNLKTAMENATAPGDQIWVAQGTYTPHASDRTQYFTLKKGVKLYGGFAGTETQLEGRDWKNNPTVLSGDLSSNDDGLVTYSNSLRSDNAYRVVYVEGSNTLIDGVTITGGQANNTGNNLYNRGGAIYKSANANSLTIKNSIISKNVSNREGNVHMPFLSGSENTLHIENCITKNNFARYGAGFSTYVDGGAVLDVKVHNALFHANVAGDVSAGDGFSGSSLFFGANDGRINLEVINSTFTENEDLGTNGTNDKGTIVIRRLNNNTTSVAHAVFHNNIFYQNMSSPVVVNPQVIGFMNRPTHKLNSLVFTHNISNQTDFSAKATAVTASDNINQDPMFTDAVSQDFTLAAGSPAINSGNNSKVPATLLSDLSGNIRIASSTVDRGAYEYGSVPRNFVAPTAVAQNLTVQLDNTNAVVVNPEQVDDGSSDDDTPANQLVFSLDRTTFGCADVGANTVVLTVEDISGNQATATAVITIEDKTPPVAVAQDIVVVLDAVGAVSVAPDAVNHGSNDNCTADAALLLAIDKTEFTCADLGTHVVTLTVQDAAGNTATTTAEIEVQDAMAPAVTTQNIEVALDASGMATITADRVNDNSADNCTEKAGLTFSLDQSTFTCADLGVKNVTLTVADAAGNQSSAQAAVTVVDKIAPVATAKQVTVQLDATGVAHVTPQMVNDGSADNCTAAVDLELSLDKTAFSCAEMGANTVTLTVADLSGNTATTTAVVTVEDKLAPEAVVKNTSVQLDATGNVSVAVSDIDNGSSDNCTASQDLTFSLDKTDFTCAELGTNTVTLTVTDAAGNQTAATAVVTVQDVTPPVVIAQNLTVQLGDNGEATIAAASVNNGSHDNCTPQAGLLLSLDKKHFTCADLGNNTVELSVEDESGNVAVSTATVTVEDIIAPVARAKDITVRLDANNTATIEGADLDNLSTDNCSGVLSFSVDIATFTENDLGANAVVLTVADKSGNSSTATATVTVKEYKQSQTISFETPSGKTYGDADFALSAVASSQLPVDIAVVSGSAVITNNLLSITGAGEVTLELTQAGNDDYLPATPVRKSFTVAKAPLTVTADSHVITYGDALPSLTYEYSGFVGQDDASTLAEEPSISTTATASANAGVYPIALVGGASDNYSFVLVNGELTIEKADQVITITPIEDMLNDEVPFTVDATVDSNLELSYTIDGPATIVGNQVTLTGAVGVVTITVSQSGNENYNPATATVVFEVAIPAGMEDQLLEVNIYPNPAHQYIQIEGLDASTFQAVMYDVKGIPVVTKQLDGMHRQLDVRNVKSGVYFLKIQSENSSTTTTILIDR